MTKKATQPVDTQEQSVDPVFSEILKLSLDHNLTREDFYFLSGKKKGNRKVNS